MEQVGRHSSYRVFGFNGTGGVWRREAIEHAGGFSWDTVTEDLYLSYKAYLAGYKFVYVRECPQQLEVPSNILAHIQQKQRWTKGFLQVFRMIYVDILLSPQVPISVKLEALMHLAGPIQLIFKVLCLVTYPYLVFHRIDSYSIKLISCAAALEPILAAVHTVFAKVPCSNGSYSAWSSRVLRLLVIPPYFALRFGMALFEARAIAEGFFSDDATFLTTPKEGMTTTGSKVSQETMTKKIQRSLVDDLTAWCGLALALHQTIYVFLIDSQFTLDSYSYVFVRLMNLMICMGLFWVNAGFLLAKHAKTADTLFGAIRPRPKLLFFGLVLLTTNSFLALLILVSCCRQFKFTGE